MSKRKLSRQQAWRIEKIQQERANRAQRRDAVAQDALATGELGPEQHGLVTAADARLTAVDLRVADHGASGILSRFGAMSLTRVALIDNDVGLRFGRGAEPQHTLRFFQGNRVPWIACGLFCPVAGPVLGP